MTKFVEKDRIFEFLLGLNVEYDPIRIRRVEKKGPKEAKTIGSAPFVREHDIPKTHALNSMGKIKVLSRIGNAVPNNWKMLILASIPRNGDDAGLVVSCSWKNLFDRSLTRFVN